MLEPISGNPETLASSRVKRSLVGKMMKRLGRVMELCGAREEEEIPKAPLQSQGLATRSLALGWVSATWCYRWLWHSTQMYLMGQELCVLDPESS